MKKLLGIVVLGLLLSGNAYSKDNTIKNLEKCINSKSKLLDERNIKNICIFKHQKKLSTKIAKLKKIRASGKEYLFAEASLTNMSTDYLISEIILEFIHNIQYGENKGLLILEQKLNKIDQFDHYWIEPGNSDRAVISLSWDYGSLGFTYSSKSEVNKDFKLTIDNLKKYKNWSLNIKEIYGFKIN